MKKRKATPLTVKNAPQTGLSADVVAIMKLIDHAKAQGVAYFEGPLGLKFAFRRETSKSPALRLPSETGDDFIP